MKFNKGKIYPRIQSTSTGIKLYKGTIYPSIWAVIDEIILAAPVLTATQIGDYIYIEWEVG